MGKKIHIDRVREFMSSTPVFTAGDVERLVGDGGYAHLMLHNLVKGGEAHRLTRGWYASVDDPVLAVFALGPAYLGLQEALSLRGLWEQETNPVLVTPSRAKPGTRRVFGQNVVVHRIDPRYFFGFDHVQYEGFAVPVSDLEKTLIDLVYFGEAGGIDALGGLLDRSDKSQLKSYLKRYPPAFVSQFEALMKS